MSRTRPALVPALVLAVVAGAAGRVEAAAKTVTLLGVSGVDGRKFAKALESELGELYDLVPGERYRTMSIQLGRRGASPAEVRAVAQAIGVDAVIGGAVVGRGHARRLLVAVREGRSGRVIAHGRYDLSGRTLPLIRERVAADLVRALERVRPVGAATPPSTVEANPPADTDQTPEAPAAAAEDVTPAVAIERTAAPRRAVAGVQAGVGPSLLTRSLGFDVASAPGYSGGTVVGIRAEGAVFPLALSAELAAEHPVLASFGFVGSYEHVFGFTSSATSGRSRGEASRWNVRFIGRIPLGRGAVAGTLALDTGLQQMSWSAAAPVDIGVPDVRYDLVTAGLGWERPLVARWAIVAVRLAGMGLVSMGDIALDTQYGRGTGWGLSAAASLTMRPRDWLWLRLVGDWDRVAMRFAGAGTRFARHATDDWIGGALEVGFAL